MKLLFDHNLAQRLVVDLADVYANSQHVHILGMSTASDEAIWLYAQQHGMVIVSKDSDFYYRSMLRGHPPKVIWIRLGNCTTTQVADLLRLRYASLQVFEQDPSASFLALA